MVAWRLHLFLRVRRVRRVRHVHQHLTARKAQLEHEGHERHRTTYDSNKYHLPSSYSRDGIILSVNYML